MVTPFLPEDERLVAVREALPATAAGIYLNAGSVGPLPAETHRLMTELADHELRVGRAGVDDFAELLERMDEARAAVAAVGGTAPATIALVHSTTEAMNIASWAIDWRPGDRAVTTQLEHPGALGPLLALRDRLGVELVFVDVGSGGDDEATLAALDAAIVPGTRLVSVSHVAWTTGALLPIERIAELAHGRGALLAVDGAQAIGAIPVGLASLGADLYAIPAQKWLLGPEGIAALYVAPGPADRLRQTFAGFFSFADEDLAGRAVFHPSARRFETSGYSRPRSPGWPAAWPGCRCTSGSTGSIAAVPRSLRRSPDDSPRSRASSS